MPHLDDVFISYGRADSKVFAGRLHDRLKAGGFEVWFDQNDIPLAVDFQDQIDQGINHAHNFIFIIAPHSVKSAYCRKEIELAIKRGKRIIPILHIKPDDDVINAHMHPIIRKLNWLPFREQADPNKPLDQWPALDNFDQAFANLEQLLRANQDVIHLHTELLLKAIDWEHNYRTSTYLLVGKEREAAEEWLAALESNNEQPPCYPSDVHCEYICESIKNANNLLTDVFVSYATANKELRDRIRRSLARKAITTWVHDLDIQKGKPFEQAIYEGIEQADNFMFLISPESVESEWCLKELAHVKKLNKRIIPLLIEPVEAAKIPADIRQLQYIDFTDNKEPEPYSSKQEKSDYDRDIDDILNQLNTDSDYFNRHKVFLTQALKWQRQGGNASILLRGYNLQNAQAWLKLGLKRDSHLPTELHREFIEASAARSEQLHTDVFISYSRKDADFARRLNDQLQIYGKTTWFDLESIAEGADFKKEIFTGIETADNFLFIISPDSIGSKYCVSEVEFAAKLGKRFLPLAYRTVDSNQLPQQLASLQWTNFRPDETEFEAAFRRLIRALDEDREYVKNHTLWLQKAREWEAAGKNEDTLLRGNAYTLAEAWLEEAESQRKQPAPAELHIAHIKASRERIAQKERRKLMMKRASSVLMLLTALAALIALWQWNTALKRVRTSSTLSMVSDARTAFYEGKYQHAIHLSERAYTLSLPDPPGVIVENLNWMEQRLENMRDSLNYPNVIFYAPDTMVIREVCWSQSGQSVAVRSERASFDPSINDYIGMGLANRLEMWHSPPRKGWDIHDNLHAVVPFDSTYVLATTFTIDGQAILIADSHGQITRWDLAGVRINTVLAPDLETGTVHFSAKNRYILRTRFDQSGYLYKMDGVPIDSLGSATQPFLQARFADGCDLVLASYSGSGAQEARLEIVNPVTGQHHFVSSRSDESPFLAPDGNYLVTIDGSLGFLWSLKSEKADPAITRRNNLLRDLNMAWLIGDEGREHLTDLKGHTGDIGRIVFSTDSRRFLTLAQDATARLWNIDGQLLARLQGHKKGLTDAAFSPDRQFILTVAADNTARLWDSTGVLIDIYQYDRPITQAGFVPGHNAVFIAVGNRLLIYDQTRSLIRWADRTLAGLVPDADYWNRYFTENIRVDDMLAKLHWDWIQRMVVKYFLLIVDLVFLLIAGLMQVRSDLQAGRKVAAAVTAIAGASGGLLLWYSYMSNPSETTANILLMLLSLGAATVSFVLAAFYYEHPRYRIAFSTLFFVLLLIAGYHSSPFLNKSAFQTYSDSFMIFGLAVMSAAGLTALIYYALQQYYTNNHKTFYIMMILPTVIWLVAMFYIGGLSFVVGEASRRTMPFPIILAVCLSSVCVTATAAFTQLRGHYREGRRMSFWVYLIGHAAFAVSWTVLIWSGFAMGVPILPGILIFLLVILAVGLSVAFLYKNKATLLRWQWLGGLALLGLVFGVTLRYLYPYLGVAIFVTAYGCSAVLPTRLALTRHYQHKPLAFVGYLALAAALPLLLPAIVIFMMAFLIR